MMVRKLDLTTTVEQLWERYIGGATTAPPDQIIATALRCGFLSGVASIMSYMQMALGGSDVSEADGAAKMDALYHEACDLLLKEARNITSRD